MFFYISEDVDLYKILLDIGRYIQSPQLFFSMIMGVVLGAWMFNRFVIPLHNLVKYYFIRKFGDDSAFREELVSRNPKDNRHAVGFLSSIFISSGFAAPTLFDRANFRRPALHTFFVSLSGIFTYLAVFFVTYSMFAVPRVLNLFSISSVKLETMDTNIFGCLYYILFYGIYYLSVTCLYSAILNVLPVYPLDMGDTLYMCAPLNWQDALRNNELFITLGLFILNFLVLSAPRGLFYIITVPVRNGFLWIVSLICGVPFT